MFGFLDPVVVSACNDPASEFLDCHVSQYDEIRNLKEEVARMSEEVFEHDKFQLLIMADDHFYIFKSGAHSVYSGEQVQCNFEICI
jgi:hypothetical protein